MPSPPAEAEPGPHKPFGSLSPQAKAEVISRLEASHREAEKDRPEREAYRTRREAEDRAELVRPAPKDFKPQPGRKARLTLTTRNTMMRKGESFWYRMELQNVGQEPITLDERPSFWKIGNEMMADPYRFYITPPKGEEQEVYSVSDSSIHSTPIEMDYPASMTKEESDRAFEQLLEAKDREASRRAHLWVILQPGEILVSRPWRFGSGRERARKMIDNENPDPPVSGTFRELTQTQSGRTSFKFDKLGTYRIKVVLNDTAGKPPTEEDIQRRIKIGLSREYTMKDYEERVMRHLGRIESNVVEIEVVP